MSVALQSEDIEAARVRYLNDGVIKMYLAKISQFIELSRPLIAVDLNTMEMTFLKNEYSEVIDRMKFELEDYISKEYGNYLKRN